jgi:hypothetical protein
MQKYPLSNVCDKYPYDYRLERLLSRDKVFFSKPGERSKKKFIKRGFGIRTGIKRIGNESIGLLYLDIWSKGGVRLTPILESEFFNSNAQGSYLKAISAKPIWEWSAYADNPYLERELLGMLGLSGPLIGKIDTELKEVVSAINSSGDNSISIDTEHSKIMVAATRSEATHLKKAYAYIEAIIESITEEFDLMFGER